VDRTIKPWRVALSPDFEDPEYFDQESEAVRFAQDMTGPDGSADEARVGHWDGGRYRPVTRLREPSAKEGSHFWIMTLVVNDSDGTHLFSGGGLVTPDPGVTRLSLMTRLRDELVSAEQVSQGAGVLAFDLQPNKL
jgi:hypothetical protein